MINRTSTQRLKVAFGNPANRAMFLNAVSLVGTTVVTSALGFVYWGVAARFFPTVEVGVASAAISAMMLLGTIGMLGFGTLLIKELAQHKSDSVSLVMTASLLAAVAGLALGLVFSFLANAIQPDLAASRIGLGSSLAFSLGVALTAVTMVIDQALLGLLRGEIQLGRNALFSIAKLAAVWAGGLLLADKNGMSIYNSWTVGNVISLIALAGFVWIRAGSTTRFRIRWYTLRGLGRQAIAHHVLNLTLTAPNLALPLVVVSLISATANAYFYVAWMIAGFVFVGPTALSTALYAVGVRTPEELTRRLRFSLLLSVAAGVVAYAVIFVCASPLLSFFGSEYSAQGVTCLRILGLGCFPLIFKFNYVAIRRVQDALGTATIAIGVGGVLELALAAVGSQMGGLEGLSIGWVVAVGIEALVLLPPIVQKSRHSRPLTGSLNQP